MPSNLTSAQITLHEKRTQSEVITEEEAEDCLEKLIGEASHNHSNIEESLKDLREKLNKENSEKSMEEAQEEMWGLSMRLRGPNFSIQEVL